MGADFGDVRVHDDTKVADRAHDISAQAFTSGSDIVFNRGRFDPSSDQGRHLLGHELTHVLQQRHSGPAIQRQVDTEEEAKRDKSVPGGHKGKSEERPGGVDYTSRKINFYVTDEKGKGLTAAKKADVWTILTSGGANEVGKQISEALGNAKTKSAELGFGGTEFNVGNLTVDQHGGYIRTRSKAYINFAGHRYPKKGKTYPRNGVAYWKKVLAPVAKTVGSSSTVVFTACNLAGGKMANETYSLGQVLLDDIADALGAKAYANMSWSGVGSDEFNTDNKGFSHLAWTNLRDGSDYVKDYKSRPNAYKWAGKWAVATPGKGMNVKEINALYLKKDGSFGQLSDTMQILMRVDIAAQIKKIEEEAAKRR